MKNSLIPIPINDYPDMHCRPDQPLVLSFDGTLAYYDLYRSTREPRVRANVVEHHNVDQSAVSEPRAAYLEHLANRRAIDLDRWVQRDGAPALAGEVFERMSYYDRTFYSPDVWRPSLGHLVDTIWPELEVDDVLLALDHLIKTVFWS